MAVPRASADPGPEMLDGRLVVCGLDGGPRAANAAHVAARLAQLAHARLALVAVAPTPATRMAVESPPWTVGEALRVLDRTARDLADRVAVDCYLELGDPARRLVGFAERTRPLVLVVAARRDAGGSPYDLTGEICREPPCPVLVVPDEPSCSAA